MTFEFSESAFELNFKGDVIVATVALSIDVHTFLCGLEFSLLCADFFGEAFTMFVNLGSWKVVLLLW